MEIDFCLDVELRTGNYLRIVLSKSWPNEKKFCLARIKLQLRLCQPGRHTIKQWWNFSRDSLAFETEYHRNKWRFMVKLKIITLSSVAYKVNNTGEFF